MDMIKVRTVDLIWPALDWAIWLAIKGEATEPCKRAKLIWTSLDEYWSPSTDWRQGGPLIEKYMLSINPAWDGSWQAINRRYYYVADTILIAACRAIVHSKLGEIVQVPAELMPKTES